MKLAGDYEQRFIWAVGLLSLADVALWGVRVLLTGTSRYAFIPWNLLLAWMSLVMTVILIRSLHRQPWSSGKNVLLTLLWLVILPNTWYLLTDFIHVAPNAEISQLFDIVLVSLLVFVGFALGFASLFLIHRELMRRLGQTRSYLAIELIILLASFAIYVGRDLRWNSWDVITNPGVIVNVTDQLVDPFGNPRAFNVTILLFFLISLLYAAFYIFTYPGKLKRKR